jgi:acyl-CoA synthetase (AMP-forming)/AMP-acid ligase II
MITAQQVVERSLAAFRERVAIIDQHGAMTYAALGDRSARLANALLALGCSAEAPCAIYLHNDFHFIEADAACMRAGIVRVGISTRLSGDEVQFILGHSRSRVLITSQALLEKLDRAALGELAAILLIDGSAGWDGKISNYEDLLGRSSAALTVAAVAPSAAAYIIYTSGTTGRPKGATHSQAGRVAALVNMLASEIVATKDSAMVHCAPLSHGSGSKLLTFLALGAKNVILPKFEPEAFARAVEAHRGTHSFMVPTMLQMLLESTPAVARAVRGMDQITFGGAPITNALFGRALDGFGPILTQIYGSCEAPHPVTVMRPDDYAGLPDPSLLAESAGRASIASEIALRDESGGPVAPGGEGELVVRAPHMMSGYWLDAQATSEAIDADGWYATGDVASIDEQGFVYFRDRKRDLIITGGLNVYPSEVERVLADHPVVREVAVVAYPDDQWGESILACVVAHDGAAVSERELIGWLDGRIAGYKKPRKVLFMESLPKGSTNKVLKRELKARFWIEKGRRIN